MRRLYHNSWLQRLVYLIRELSDVYPVEIEYYLGMFVFDLGKYWMRDDAVNAAVAAAVAAFEDDAVEGDDCCFRAEDATCSNDLGCCRT